jgi:hypothetical protein
VISFTVSVQKERDLLTGEQPFAWIPEMFARLMLVAYVVLFAVALLLEQPTELAVAISP